MSSAKCLVYSIQIRGTSFAVNSLLALAWLVSVRLLQTSCVMRVLTSYVGVFPVATLVTQPVG